VAEPFTIRIFVPDGEPEGIRIIDRMNWTGLGLVFPRQLWSSVRDRPELGRTGIYILMGHSESVEDSTDPTRNALPTLYIGQGDCVRDRIDAHLAGKDFWSVGVVFVSSNNMLHRGHVTWLESELIKSARAAGQSVLDNSQRPNEPNLSESEKADTKAFLKEILQILPLVGVRAFEKQKPVVVNLTKEAPVAPAVNIGEPDTIVVPAQAEGFKRVFLGENCWYAIRISGGMLPKIKYIAAYQTQPISAVTYWAPIARIEPYGEAGKYRLVFAEPAKPLTPIPFADAPSGGLQGPRYTTFAKLMSAKKVMDLFDW